MVESAEASSDLSLLRDLTNKVNRTPAIIHPDSERKNTSSICRRIRARLVVHSDWERLLRFQSADAGFVSSGCSTVGLAGDLLSTFEVAPPMRGCCSEPSLLRFEVATESDLNLCRRPASPSTATPSTLATGGAKDSLVTVCEFAGVPTGLTMIFDGFSTITIPAHLGQGTIWPMRLELRTLMRL